MSLAIPLMSHLGRLAGPLAAVGSAVPAAGAAGAFGSVLESAVQKVNQSQLDASRSVQKFLTGQGEELHNVALAGQRAAIAFDLGLQVRNRVVTAYQQIMNIQL